MASPLIRFGNTAQKGEEPSIMPKMLTTSLLTMRDCCVNLLPFAVIVTSLSLEVARALPASVFFFTIHLALHLLTTVIPSNRIRFLVENAGSMRIEHFRFIRACLGLKHLQKNDLTWCTSALSPAKRSRIFSRTTPLMKLWNRKSTTPLMLLGHMTGALFFFKKEVHYVKSTYSLSCALSEQSVTLLFATVGQVIIQLLYCGVSPTGAPVIDLLFEPTLVMRKVLLPFNGTQ